MKLLQRLALGLWLGCMAPAIGTLTVSIASAQEQEQAADPTESAAESRSAAFQAVEGPQKEDVPGGPLLVAAYGIILVLLVAYVARLGALHAKNRTELDRLARVLDSDRKG